MSRQSSATAEPAVESGLLGASFVVLAAALWGLWPVWARGAAGGAATAVIAQAVGGLVALPWAIVAGRRRRAAGGPVAADARGLAWLLLLGVCNGANAWLYFRALHEGAVAPAALSHYLAPVIVALTAPSLLGEPRSSRTPAALVLALSGTVVLLFAGGDVGDGARVQHAVALGGGSAIFYASATLVAKRASTRWSDAEMFAYQALIAATLSAPFLDFPTGTAAWLRPSLGGLVSTAVPGLLFYAGLRRLPAERVAVLSYLEVLAGVLIGWSVFHERPGVGALVGGACILLAGMAVVTAPRPVASRATG